MWGSSMRTWCAFLKGERVLLPTFNFKTGKREYKDHYMQLGKRDILGDRGHPWTERKDVRIFCRKRASSRST